MANEYVTSSELKDTLELTGESFADSDISLALSAASRAVEGVCDRRFWADATANVVRYYSPESAHRLAIDDLVTLTEVAVDSSRTGQFDELWTVNSDFVLKPLNAVADGEPYTTIEVLTLRTSRYFPCEERTVRVTGKFGWAAVPDEVKLATGILASRLLKRSREVPFGVAFGVEGAALRLAREDPDVMNLLSDLVRYRY